MRVTGLPTAPSPAVFSFAGSEVGPLARYVIQTIEKATGQRLLKRLYDEYLLEERPSELFWQDAVRVLRLGPKVSYEGGAHIPQDGPVLIVANHPFGVVDGLVMGSEVSRVRQDYRIVAHRIFHDAEQLADKVLPIDFAPSRTALRTNLETRGACIDLLKDGGLLALFPAGAVASAPRVLGRAVEAEWKTFAAKLAMTPGLTVVPICFHGQNSLPYMAAKKVSVALAYALTFREVRRRMGGQIQVTVRAPIPGEELRQLGCRRAVLQRLREAVGCDRKRDCAA